jgi:hypothetical protein
MKIFNYLLCSSFLLLVHVLLPINIRLICTAALTNDFFDFRKQQYIEGFNILSTFGYNDVYVVEAIKKQGPTFLNDYSKNVFYATCNDRTLNNLQINEATTLLEGIRNFNFDPEDMIIKINGRYHLQSDYFLKIVEKNMSNYDGFFRGNLFFHGDCGTLCYAIRCKYLREMLEEMDYDYMNRIWTCLEVMVGNYIHKKIKQGKMRVFFVDKLDIKYNAKGSSLDPSIREDWIRHY